jgi:hypothetical protein
MASAEQNISFVTVTIIPNAGGGPAGKLADAELHFHGSPLGGLKLIGFSVWARRDNERTITFPARQYSVNGERRSFALLRPTTDAADADAIRQAILEEYSRFEGVSDR